MELQLKLDELQSSEISIQVNGDSHLSVILSLQWNDTSDRCFHTLIWLFERFTVFLSHQYRENRMEQEKELLQNQNTWLNSELKSKTDELYTLSRDKGKEILELKCSLQSKKEEVWGFSETLIYQSYIVIKSLICNSLTCYIVCHQVTRLQDQGNTLKKNNDSMQKSTEDMMNKLKEVHYHLPVPL